MLFITTVAQSYQDPKIQECGMQWDAATTKWENQTKPKDAMFELRIARTGKA